MSKNGLFKLPIKTDIYDLQDLLQGYCKAITDYLKGEEGETQGKCLCTHL